jgi:hypothetical protein
MKAQAVAFGSDFTCKTLEHFHADTPPKSYVIQAKQSSVQQSPCLLIGKPCRPKTAEHLF